MTNKPPPEEKKQTPKELKARWLELNDTMEKVVEGKRGVREQSRIIRAQIREWISELKNLRETEVEDFWLARLEKITDEAWENYQASVEEVKSGK